MVASEVRFDAAMVERIRARVRGDGALTRTALSREVCDWLGWRGVDGRRKEKSCRLALLKLARSGRIELPAARPTSLTAALAAADEGVEGVATVQGSLAALGAVWLVPVDDAHQARIWRALLARHHPLGTGPLCGAQLRYLVASAAGWLGALGFGSAAWRLAPRDRWIGWDEASRAAQLERIVTNSRFLIVPSVQVPHLASHVLGQALRRLATDWQARHGVVPLLVETFVDPGRHRGTCYRAANWTPLGSTQGRGRQDRGHARALAPKDIWVRPLHKHWRRQLRTHAAARGTPAAATTGSAAADWTVEEFGGCALPDARLQARLLELARDFYARPGAQIPQACASRARTKAAYRFFAHPDCRMDCLLQPHQRATAARLAQHPVVLAVQDSTSLDYTAHPGTVGLGPIGAWVNGPQGLHLHSAVAFSPAGLPLGLLHTQVWARDARAFGKKVQRHRLPIEHKESAKWLAGYRTLAAVQQRCPDTMIVNVADRESDLYEMFETAIAQPQGPRLLIRATHDRAVQAEQQRLWATVQAQPAAGVHTIEVSRQGARPARRAHLEVRFAAVTLLPPQRRGAAARAPIALWAVLAHERQAPDEVKQPLDWMLLTTVPTTDLAQAVERLQWYAQRWGIEVFHRTLKSGCRIEQRQLAGADRLEAALAIDLVVAWRIHHLTHLGRHVPQAPCTVYFEDPQWKALTVFTTRQPIPPPTPPSLREALRRVASLGGFLGRKSDGEPGTKSLWIGLQRLDDITATWSIMTAATQLRVPRTIDSG
jgi:hypothetical protein